MFSMFFRRRNPANSDYVTRCKKALRSGRPLLPAPSTIGELYEALTLFPQHSVPHRPSAADLRGMKLPAGWPNQEAGQWNE